MKEKMLCPKCGRTGLCTNPIEPWYQCKCGYADFEQDFKRVDAGYEARKQISNYGLKEHK